MVIRSSRPTGRSHFSPPPSSAVYRNIAFSFLALTIVVVIGALWVSSVHARVTIKVKRNTANVDTFIEVSKNPQQGQLQGRVVHDVFEKIQEFSVNAQAATSVGSVVQGTVKIINNYSRPQTLVQKTRLLTSDGRLYRIDKTVTLGVKETALVTAHSDAAGASYALPVGTKLSIPGLWIDLQKWIYAETVSGFTGGSQTAKIVSAGEVTQSQQALQDTVFQQAKKALDAKAGVGSDWSVVYVQKVLDSKNNVTPGQSADQFLASAKLDVTAVYYPTKDMEAIIRQKLKDKIPEGRELLDYDPSRVVYTVESVDLNAEKARITLAAQASSRLTVTSPQLSKEAIYGLTDEEAKTKLMGTDGVESVDIKIRPSWIHKIPSTKDRLDVVVE
ncbi:hypothetical protein KBC54_01085 [Patescibacteria group bacterium]|nr:hypothetical protein [Patescibacteria group bacterium]